MNNLKKYFIPYTFVLPAVLLVLCFIVAPVFYSFRMSFYNWDGILKPTFAGLGNYTKLFKDPSFYITIMNNIKFCFFVVIVTVVFGFLFAAAIHRRLKGWKIYKFIYFLPVMLSLTVVGSLFIKILDPSYGPINLMLKNLGLGSIAKAWLGDPKTALYALIAVTGWQYSGFTMILFLTAMEGIPNEIHDAATIDGVNGFQRLFYIIFPSIKRMFYVITMTQMIFSFKSFDLIYVMTNGGPAGMTEVLGTLMYRYAFKGRDFGLGSAVAIVMTVLIAAISLIYIKISNLGSQEIE
jgi:ABC-type sugar transport system permease subunit